MGLTSLVKQRITVSMAAIALTFPFMPQPWQPHQAAVGLGDERTSKKLEPPLPVQAKWEPEYQIRESEAGEVVICDYAQERQRPEVVLQAKLLFEEGIALRKKAQSIRANLANRIGVTQFTRLAAIHEAAIRMAELESFEKRLDKEREKPEEKQLLSVLCDLDEKIRNPMYQDAAQMLATRNDADSEFLKQLERADKVARQGRGLQRKAQRQIACLLYGCQYDGSVCGKVQGYKPFPCKNRYCALCGPAVFARFFEKYMALEPKIEEYLAKHPTFRLRILDLTTRSFDEMPKPSAIQKFEQDVKKLQRRIAEHFGLQSKDVAYLYCTEFGAQNSNLHCHGLLISPYIEQRLISDWWREIRGDGSFRVHIAEATSFRSGLAHALEYTGKYAASSPERAVELEIAFNGCRRVHLLGWIYGIKTSDGKSAIGSAPCPCKEPGCLLALRTDLGWQRLPYFEDRGIRPLEAATAETQGVRAGP